MIHFIRATDLWMEPKLASSMFEDRRKQFGERLGWPVKVDVNGYERDQYDVQNPIYVIVEGEDGQHAGSMRLLPTSGPTMIEEHFSETLGNRRIADPQVWECTRFCLAPNQRQRTAVNLLAAGARLMQAAQLSNLVAIFDERMIRVYNHSGVRPELIGSHSYECGKVYSGYWSFSREKFDLLMSTSRIDPIQLEVAISNFSIPWSDQSPASRMSA